MDSEVTTAPVESPVAVKAVGGAVGVGSGLGLVLVAVGLEPDLVARIVGVLAGLVVLVAGVGAARRCLSYAVDAGERALRYDLNGDGRVGEDIRIVPLYHARSVSMSGSTASVEENDLRYMIDRLDIEAQTGWTQREWLNQQLPSGREIVSVDVGPYAAFVEMLERIGAIVDRDERRKGRLAKSKGEILRELLL